MIVQEVQKRISEIERMLKQIDQLPDSYPSGRLRIGQRKGRIEYFWVEDSYNANGKYIKKADYEIASQLAQKDYYIKFKKQALLELKVLREFLANFESTKLVEIYSSMIPARKELVEPLLLPDDEFSQRWIARDYCGNPYHPDELVYKTNRGEMVRSKSEKMIADMYHEAGIPYLYEYPLKLKDGTTKYPDFAILSITSRKIIYHEHMGVFDDEEYRKKALIKIREYEKNGIIIGKNLYISFESSYVPLDINSLKKSIITLIK